MLLIVAVAVFVFVLLSAAAIAQSGKNLEERLSGLCAAGAAALMFTGLGNTHSHEAGWFQGALMIEAFALVTLAFVFWRSCPNQTVQFEDS